MTNLSKTDYFPSLAQMREEHVKLLDQRLTKEDELSDLFGELKSFINRGRETGILLGSDDDRWAAQSLLDYWSIALHRAGHQPPDFILAKYNLDKAPPLDKKDCPYPGLKVFEEDDRDLFFGRTELLRELLERLKSQQLLVVVGPPNSGKSSLVRAGLLPELKARKPDGSENWFCLPPKTPGLYLLDNLDELSPVQIELEQVRANRDQTECTTVLVIDQFEDLFTLCSDNQIRQEFAANLLKLLEPQYKIKIILTMRQDFKTDFENLSSSFNKFFKNRDRDKKYDYVEVIPFTSSELKEAIEIPAKQKGLQFEGDLIGRLVHELVLEPMPLPLLQFVLMKLWEKREKNLITDNIYHQVTGVAEFRNQSGVRWALYHTADEFYTQQLSPREQETVQHIFLQLLQPSLDSEVKSFRLQRRALYREGEDKNQTNRVIAELSQLNILRLTKQETSKDDRISDEDLLEVVHPSLADSWPVLKSWLKNEKSEMKYSLALSLKADDWERQEKNSDLLLQGKQINKARQFIKYAGTFQVKSAGKSKSPTTLEKEFVQKSLRRRQINRFKWTVSSLTILGLIIGLPALVYYADLQKQHTVVIQELKNRLDNTETELKIAKKSRKNAEDLLESYRESLQETKNIQKKAEQLLEAAEKTQRNVEKQQKNAEKILKEAETTRRDSKQKPANFLWGMLTGISVTFLILIFWRSSSQGQTADRVRDRRK